MLKKIVDYLCRKRHTMNRLDVSYSAFILYGDGTSEIVKITSQYKQPLKYEVVEHFDSIDALEMFIEG
jgi:hypothetical protein